ncbi:MAG: FAD-dependent oxidoreductase [Planctomycetes bacterium]|nr:FAD-dependent oxidoreductase [Planctomycetota bacterium]
MAVIGGGLAGMSAALELSARGLRVVVLEASERVGGKMQGWRGPDGSSLEHGLHGCWSDYANFRELLDRVGASGNLTAPVDSFRVVHRDGSLDVLSFWNLPSPFHVLGLLHNLGRLNLRSKLSVLRAGFRLLAFDPRVDYAEMDAIDFHAWTLRAGLSRRAVEVIFEPTIRSNLFLAMEHASAAAGMNAFIRGLRRTESWRFAWFTGNAQTHLWDLVVRHLESHGARILCRAKVVELRRQEGSVKSVVYRDGAGAPHEVAADHFVLAVDIESCKDLVKASLGGDPFFTSIHGLSTTDSLVARSWFRGAARPRMSDAMLLGFRLVDAFVDVTRIQSDAAAAGEVLLETHTYLGRPWLEKPDDHLRRLILEDLLEALPELRSMTHLRTVVLKHAGLFTAFRPDAGARRPTSRTPIANLHLAGDWVRSPLPVMFMENAVITGKCAASGVLEALGRPPVPIIPEPAADIPYRALQGMARAGKRVWRTVRSVLGHQPIGALEVTRP